MEDINESDCCGNGCANCVLNIKPAKSLKADKSGKQNILQKYKKFSLINKNLHVPEVNNVWELHFKSIESNKKDFILDINPGYHLMMRRCCTEMEKEQNEKNEMALERKYLLRPYSPCWWDCIEMEFKILVHIIKNGPMSDYIEKLRINEEVEFRGPIGTFEYEMDVKGEKCLLLISQGVAIAPVIGIIEDILNNEDDMCRIIHISCFRDIKHIYFRDKLYNFNKYWNYKGHIYVSQELCNNLDCLKNLRCLENCQHFKSKLKYNELIRSKRFTENDLQQILANLKYKKENTLITLAGLGTFQQYFKELLEKFDYKENNIYLL